MLRPSSLPTNMDEKTKQSRELLIMIQHLPGGTNTTKYISDSRPDFPVKPWKDAK